VDSNQLLERVLSVLEANASRPINVNVQVANPAQDFADWKKKRNKNTMDAEGAHDGHEIDNSGSAMPHPWVS